MVDLADFVPHAPLDPTVIDEYRGRVPDELVEIWEQHGLGDLITWEPSLGVTGILYREGRVAGLGGRLRTVFTLLKAGGAAYLSRSLAWDIFPEAVAAHGELPYEESFVFVPLLSLGGKADVSSLHKRHTLTAIQMMVEVQGVIGH